VQRAPAAVAPALGAGVAGKTAHHGLLNVPGIRAGEVLLVSAVAGSVGSLVGQIGKLKGARTIGGRGRP
jgi:hypothetical protein